MRHWRFGGVLPVCAAGIVCFFHSRVGWTQYPLLSIDAGIATHARAIKLTPSYSLLIDGTLFFVDGRLVEFRHRARTRFRCAWALMSGAALGFGTHDQVYRNFIGRIAGGVGSLFMRVWPKL